MHDACTARHYTTSLQLLYLDLLAISTDIDSSRAALGGANTTGGRRLQPKAGAQSLLLEDSHCV